MWPRILAVAAFLCVAGCSDSGGDDGVTGARIVSAPEGEWLSYGRDYGEQRYSPLASISTENVGELGLAWFADLDTNRGQEGTPLVIDGKIYITTAWSMVKAYDAKSGELIWEYDPEVPRAFGAKACCDVGNRGVAAWGDKLFVGTIDGRLIALDREDGSVKWDVVTVDQNKAYTITGAPRVVNGKVIIGNGGGEYAVRGYITAYDADDGKQLWRFYTVPGSPDEAEDEPEYLASARKTWNGEFWKLGGGGTVWDSMAYDAELDLLYIGVGNGSPWDRAVRSPGGGDNLYISSIVAIKPDDGAYVWHYQTTPGDAWDYTATQHIMLADLEIDGATRKVLMQAPKNGFFYVLDRATGELISANNYAPQTWATGFDMKTGRPIENPAARYGETGKPFLGVPGPPGAHGWAPMAFSPTENLVFIPTMSMAYPYVADTDWKPDWKRGFNTGTKFSEAAMPADAEVRKQARAATSGGLVAWDPIKQEERWRVKLPNLANGGLLSTAGGLIFQGQGTGEFSAYKANDGSKVWSFAAQTGIIAPPITYMIEGEQYIAVLVGSGGAMAISAGGIIADNPVPVPNISRLLVFRLGGDGKLPDAPELARLPLDPPAFKGTAEQVNAGKYLYGRYCGICHGDAAVGSVVLPDLRRSPVLESADTWKQVVYDGLLEANGMVGFGESLSEDQVESLRQYVIARAHEDKALGEK